MTPRGEILLKCERQTLLGESSEPGNLPVKSSEQNAHMYVSAGKHLHGLWGGCKEGQRANWECFTTSQNGARDQPPKRLVHNEVSCDTEVTFLSFSHNF